jgi:acetyltransferase-like isoleucine patch superfamily enzyme
MKTRRIAKWVIFVISLVCLSPLIIIAWLEKRISKGEMAFIGTSQLLALVPGMFGTWLRSAYYFTSLERCSWEVHVGFGSIFTHRKVTLGKNVSMGSYCVIGHADIGDHAMLASRISIPSGKRQHLDKNGKLSTVPRFDRVSIGRESWVGEGAIIMADIGERSIVSAGAVVIKEMPGDSLIAGNPATVVKQFSRH